MFERETAKSGDDLEPTSSEEALKCIEPLQDFEWNESVANQGPAADVSDDVNGLSLALDNKSSYLTYVHNSNPLINEGMFPSKYVSDTHSESL